MSNGAYAGLRRAARAESPAPENPETMPEDEGDTEAKGKKKKDTEMTEEEHKAAIAEAETKAKAAGFAEANERFAKVTASEHYAGRELLAHKLLGNAKLDADEIIDTLSASEKKVEFEASEEAKAAAAEEAGRKEMQAALGETTNSKIDAGAGAQQQEKTAASSSLWDNAIARISPNKAA